MRGSSITVEHALRTKMITAKQPSHEDRHELDRRVSIVQTIPLVTVNLSSAPGQTMPPAAITLLKSISADKETVTPMDQVSVTLHK